jgi:phospholipid/cholesterol/gamma-HCH transport system permease protein
MKSAEPAQSVLQVHPPSEDGLVFSITGPLDSMTTGPAWRTALRVLQQAKPRRVIVDAARLAYCNGAGAALLLERSDRYADVFYQWLSAGWRG